MGEVGDRHINLGVVSIKMAFKSKKLDEITKRVSVEKRTKTETSNI